MISTIVPKQRSMQRNQQLGAASVYVGIFLVAIATYFVLTFVPPWYKSWKGKSLIGEAISGMTLEGLDEHQLKESVVGKLAGIGVEITTNEVDIEVDKENKMIRVKADWKAVIKFPFTRQTMTMHFVLKSQKKSS